MSDSGDARPGRTHLAVALGRPENRIAAGVTLSLALAIFAVSRLPLPADVSLDLREEDTWSAVRHATLLGFSEPGLDGRTLTETPARVVFNRPLPDSFVLELEAVARPVPTKVVLGVGGHRYEARVDARGAPAQLQIENPAGARQIAVGALLAPGNELVLRRLTVRAP